jgi:hypothetical protein
MAVTRRKIPVRCPRYSAWAHPGEKTGCDSENILRIGGPKDPVQYRCLDCGMEFTDHFLDNSRDIADGYGRHSVTDHDRSLVNRVYQSYPG